MENVIIVIILLLVIGGALTFIYSRRKKGECIGCPYSKECRDKKCGCHGDKE